MIILNRFRHVSNHEKTICFKPAVPRGNPPNNWGDHWMAILTPVGGLSDAIMVWVALSSSLDPLCSREYMIWDYNILEYTAI